ncbi:MAG TPA: hypothetical protein VEK57_12655, partial [Thermoanaerobaculia bacterium]|nr:hypothetical protein [Thermoanaerobaculia bacterium]
MDVVFFGLELSFAVTATVNEPEEVGVPKSAPLAFICIPFGSPVADHVYGAVPPVAASALFAAYPTPAVAVVGSNAVLVMESGCVAAATVSVRFFEADFFGLELSFAVTATVNEPEEVGVPKSAPLAFICIPLGNPVADHVYGVEPPVAASEVFAPYPTPTVAVAGSKAVLVIESGWVAAATVSGRFFEADFFGLELSFAVTATVNEPEEVGAPKSAPLAFICIPFGSPVADHVYGVVPPVAASEVFAPYPTPTVAVPGSKAVLVIESGWVASATVSGRFFEADFCGELLSSTVTVTVNEPEAVGVPKSAPLSFICIPLGSPVADQVYGVEPPVAASEVFAPYPTPTVAVAGSKAVLVIESGCVAATTVSGRFFEADFCGELLSSTVTVTVNEPAMVGVPKSAPLSFICIPLDSPVADQVYGVEPPVAASEVFAPYPTPTVAVAGSKAVLVIESGWVAPATMSGRFFEADFCGELLSSTVTVTVNEPAMVGVPKSAPLSFICIPFGSPVADQVYGVEPPVAASEVFAPYPTPTVAVAGSKTVLVIESGWVAPATVSGRFFEADFCGELLSSTVTVTVNEPAMVGVPKSAPLAFICIPLGRPVADQVYGVEPPVAASEVFAPYPTPTVAVAGSNAVLVMESDWVAAATVSVRFFEADFCG